MKLSIVHSDDTPRLLSFPQSFCAQSDELSLSILQKGSGKRKKREIIGDLNDVKLIGKDFEDGSSSNDACYYLVGKINEKNNEIECFLANHAFVMKPVNSNASIASRSFQSNFDRKQSLTEEFGSKKKKRAMHAAQSNIISAENISGAQAVDSALQSTYSSSNIEIKEQSAAQEAIEFNRKQLLPKYDVETSEVVDVFPVDGLLAPSLKASLIEYVDVLKGSHARLDMSLLKSEVFPDNCYKSITEAIQCTESSHSDSIRIQLILLLNFLLKFYSFISTSKEHVFKRSDVEEKLGAPEGVVKYILDTFTFFRKLNGKPGFSIPKASL